MSHEQKLMSEICLFRESDKTKVELVSVDFAG